MVGRQLAYIPVLPGMDWTYGPPKLEYGIPQATKDTIACALTDFANVHFHFHLDILHRKDYNQTELLRSLAAALKLYKSQSQVLYVKYNLVPRRATVHLDHLLSLWPKLSSKSTYLPIGTLKDLVYMLANDKMTQWEIRYYVATGQASKRSSYGNCLCPEAIRDAELWELRTCAAKYDNVDVMAEIYGDDTTWEYADEKGCVARVRMPATACWPNLHFDVDRHRIVTYDRFKTGNYPENMADENFDEKVLAATRKDRERREKWMAKFD